MARQVIGENMLSSGWVSRRFVDVDGITIENSWDARFQSPLRNTDRSLVKVGDTMNWFWVKHCQWRALIVLQNLVQSRVL